MSIGERIKADRQKKGISQAALGEMLQITQQAVAKWEKDLSEPDSQMLIKLANYFEVTVDYLIGGSSSNIDANFASATTNAFLSEQEKELIVMFRQLSPYLQGLTLDTVRGWAGGSGSAKSSLQKKA